MAGLDKVRPGAPLVFPAEAYNAFVDAAQYVRRNVQGQTAAGSDVPRDTAVAFIQNNSGADRSRFDVLGLGAPLIGPSYNLDEFKNRLAMAGETPAEPGHVGKFAVLIEPIASGAIGRGLISGVVPVQIDVADADAAEYADVCDGVTAYLTAGISGSARVLWRVGGTGQQWAIVVLAAGPVEPIPAGKSQYMVRQLYDAGGGVLRPKWDWARMHS
jgi:hypothetical protein